MTALAVVSDTATPCPVCGDDPHAVFQAIPWAFHVPRIVRCPLCLPAGSDRVWRGVLEPYLKEST